jgi:hypothetical protein
MGQIGGKASTASDQARLGLQPGPIVLESEGEEVPDLKDRSVEHTAFLAVPLDLGRYRGPS